MNLLSKCQYLWLRSARLKTIVFFGILFLTLFSVSCQKDYLNVENIYSPISESKRALDSEIKLNTVISSSENSISKVSRIIKWKDAFSRKFGDTTIVYAPILFADRVTITTDGNNSVQAENICYYVSTKINERFTFYLVMKIPHQGTARLIINDWFFKSDPFYVNIGQVNSAAARYTCFSYTTTICAGEGPDQYCNTTSTTACIGDGGDTGGPPIGDHLDPDNGGTEPNSPPALADHRLSAANLPANNNSDKQVGQMCTFKTLEWISKFKGGTSTSGSLIVKYALDKNLNLAQIITVINTDGVPLSDVPSIIGYDLNYKIPTSIPNAISNGNPVFAILTVAAGGHAVMITGYYNSGDVEYFDPQSGTYNIASPNAFTSQFEVTSIK